MAKDKKPIKVKTARVYTRAQAERIISNSVPDVAKNFLAHPNYHCRLKAWSRMGKPIPESQAEQDTLLWTFQGRKSNDMSPEAAKELLIKLRAKHFAAKAENPIAEVSVVDVVG